MLVAVSAAERLSAISWPAISVSSLLAPETKDITTIAVRDAVELEGGVVLTPADEGSPQAYLGLAEPRPGQSGTLALVQPSTQARALIRFRVREPGFYRVRFWVNSRAGRAAVVKVALDGSEVEGGTVRGDAAGQKWHWSPLDSVVDLGAGEHTLVLSAWTPGMMLGSIELAPAW